MEQAVAYSRYDTYKPAQSDWLGKVPSHWQLLPGLAVLKEKKDKNTGMIEETVLSLSYGKIIIKPAEKLTGLVPESFETYQVINPNDIIIRPTDLQNDQTSLRTGIAKDQGIITSAYICLRPDPSHNPTYIHYILHAYDLLKVYYGMGSGLRQNLDYRDFKRLELGIPPRDEQDRIANFLDQKTAEIDEAITKKQRLIELLKELKAILINQAVTKGLNPDAPMRDSGVEWIGEVPEHWEVKRAKYLFREVDERSETGTEELLSVSHMTGITPRSEKNIYMFMAEDYTGSKLCQKDDLVFNIMWAWMGALGVSGQTGIVSPSYGIYRQQITGTFNSWYLEHLLRSDPRRYAATNQRITGSLTKRVHNDQAYTGAKAETTLVLKCPF
jgi:type I restriction enzyme S subunit